MCHRGNFCSKGKCESIITWKHFLILDDEITNNSFNSNDEADDATKTVAAASDSSIAVAVGAASQDYTE